MKVLSKPIYIVDDETSILQTLEGVLSDEGYEVVTCSDAEELFGKVKEQEPALLLLDIWLPGADGMKVLQEFKGAYPFIPVIMMSGHAGIEAAVTTIKMGAYDFLEKPVHLEVLLDKITGALSKKPRPRHAELPSDTRLEIVTAPDNVDPHLVSLEETSRNQHTLKKNVVINGTGLLSGRNTGIILSPLEEGAGVVFQSLDGVSIPGLITSLENYNQTISNNTFTANSTVLARGNRRVRTVEHLLAVFHMFGIDNVLVKADEEIPNIDGSARDFADRIREAGFAEQTAKRKEIVIHGRISVGNEVESEKHIVAEPMEGFEVTMRIDYPAPIHEQRFRFNPEEHSFHDEVAPARSFNTLENIDMAQKMGKVGTGYLNSHIIMHEGKVINTELRYPDEFVRHKILDLIGDLYLLGHPLRGRFRANMTSHGYNQALAQKIFAALSH